MHEDRSNQLSVGRGKSGFIIIFRLKQLISLTTGIIDGARIPKSEGIVIERHRVLIHPRQREGQESWGR